MWEFKEGHTLKKFYHTGRAGDYGGRLSSCFNKELVSSVCDQWSHHLVIHCIFNNLVGPALLKVFSHWPPAYVQHIIFSDFERRNYGLRSGYVQLSSPDMDNIVLPVKSIVLFIGFGAVVSDIVYLYDFLFD